MKPSLRLLLTAVLAIGVLVACGTPQPPTVEHELAVTLAGTGSGTVTSDPEGIDTADDDFDAVFGAGTSVTLTATANAGSEFVGFSFTGDGECGADSTANTCVVTMAGARTVTATFNLEATAPVEEDLVVNVVAGGSAAGTVTSEPAGINVDEIDGSATAPFVVGTDVTLTATATAGGFAGWTGGDCDGQITPTCTVTMSEGESPVTANFNDLTEVTFTVSSNSDDAEEFQGTSSLNPTAYPTGFTYDNSMDLELGYDPYHSVTQVVGLRFAGVAIPDGAVIGEAFVGFTAFNNPAANAPGGTGTGGAVTVTITGEASANGATFVRDPDGLPSSNISTRTETSANVSWTIVDAWTAEQVYDSADVSSIVQEVINLEGWTSGSAVVLAFTPDDLTSDEFRRAYAHNADENKAATLTVRYATLP